MNDAEAAHIAFVASVFATYAPNARAANEKRRRDYNSLPAGHKAMLPNYGHLLSEIDQRIEENARLLKWMAADSDAFLQPEGSSDYGVNTMPEDVEQKRPGDGDYERVRSVLRQIVREWTTEGAAERRASFNPILTRLEAFYNEKSPTRRRQDCQVLIPGTGLGRLVWEIGHRGFAACGNECSVYMLLAGNAILNNSKENQHICYPFIHSLSNVVSASDILSPCRFPDVDPSKLESPIGTHMQPGGTMSMAAGDFVDVYSRPEYDGTFHCIITCFFIDTASSLYSYIDTIRHALAPNGLWINLGPLLWHFEQDSANPSVELTLEDVKAVIANMGLAIAEERFIESRYTGHSKSMLSQ